MAHSFSPWAVGWPHPGLRPVVRRYIGYWGTAGPPLHRGLPSRHATLVVSLGEPVRIADGPGAAHGGVAWQGVVGGLHLRPVLIRSGTVDHGVQLELQPLGVRALLGVGAGDLADTAADLCELPVSWARRLPERLAEATGWPEVFQVLDAELLAALTPVHLTDELRQVWHTMVASRGTRAVTALATEVGWSRRHLSQRFAAATGISPKQAARLVRFEHSSALLRGQNRPDLAEVAARCGYYDQAHMTGEWRRLAGCTPGTWLREEFPFLQDSPSGFP